MKTAFWRHPVPKERKMVVVGARIKSDVEHDRRDITDASANDALERLWNALDPASVVRAACPTPATESPTQSIGSREGARTGKPSVPFSDPSVTKSKFLNWQQRLAELESEIGTNLERGIREATSGTGEFERAAADPWPSRQRRGTLVTNDPRILRVSNPKPRPFVRRIVERLALGVAALALLGVCVWRAGDNPSLHDTLPVTATTDPESKPQMPARTLSQTRPAWFSPQIFYSLAVAPSAAPPPR
jgi:hypothetical protein